MRAALPTPATPASLASRELSPWLPPLVEEPAGESTRRAWPAPPLAPVQMPELLRQHLLNGLLAACAREIQHRRAQPTGTRLPPPPLDECIRLKPAALSPAETRNLTGGWLIWLMEAEVWQAQRVLLAPAGVAPAHCWRAALKRQEALAGHLAQIVRLYQAVEERQGTDAALAALDAVLARLGALRE